MTTQYSNWTDQTKAEQCTSVTHNKLAQNTYCISVCGIYMNVYVQAGVCHMYAPVCLPSLFIFDHHIVILLTSCLCVCPQQEIRNQASEYPYRVAKLPVNRNLNRYRDVSPCESYEN